MSWANLFSTVPSEYFQAFGKTSSPQAKQSSSEAPNYLEWYRRTIPKSYTIPDHVKAIAEHLDAVTRGDIDRLLITMPPRHGKSETVTVRYPLYALERDPESNVLVTGYNERFARKFGRRTRNLAQERGLIAEDKSAADEWATTSGGLYMARGVGSPPTGTGFKLINIDDPIRRREDAESEVYREKVWDWYTDDLYTRLEPGGAIVLVMTLWHHDDIGARAVASEPEKWHVLKLPAIDDQGAALWPERYTVEDLTRIKNTIGEYGFEALYQGNPTPREGSFFKVGKINFADESDVPPLVKTCRAWDLGATENDGDYTAGGKIGVDVNGGIWILDLQRGQWGTDVRNARILSTADMDGGAVRIRGPQDPGAAGKDAALAFTRLLSGYSVKTEPVSGDKQLRADPFSAQVNAGNVTMVRGTWNAAAIEELRQFPGGKYDDIVDCFADAFTEITTGARRQTNLKPQTRRFT